MCATQILQYNLFSYRSLDRTSGVLPFRDRNRAEHVPGCHPSSIPVDRMRSLELEVSKAGEQWVKVASEDGRPELESPGATATFVFE